MASRTFLTFLLMLSEAEALVTGGFYADNGVDQTIYYPKISKRERREMQQEILSLLGLNHRPKPHSHETDTSAPRYMLDLYNNLIDRETGEVRTKEKSIANHLGNDDNNLRAMYDADIIMSFVNRGRKKRLKKCRRLHPKRFPQVKLHSSTNWPSCKRRNNTNSTSTADGKIHLRHEKDRRFWFDVSEVPLGEELMGAELRIYKDAANLNKNTHHGANFSISVFEIIQSTKSKDFEMSLVDTTNVTIEYEGWIHLNVSGPISKWLIFSDTNFGLYLRITSDDHEIHPREVRLMGSRARHDQQPFMVAFFKSSQDIHIRQTRAAKQRQRTDISHNEADIQWKPYDTFDMERIQKRSCQKWTLYVSFKELGWQDWIIAPEGYAAFYCAGECSFPLNTHMNATNHAIVQTLVHLMSPITVPKPCCAPTKLTAISVLYFDDTSNVILKKYRNMVVKSCGCH